MSVSGLSARLNAVFISEDFFLKNRLVVMNLARDLLITELDQQLQTIDSYVEKFSVSRGTVQAAMQFLIEQGCVTTQFRGHLGSYLLTKDNDKLWGFSGFGTLTGAISLPLGPLVSGFATGICDCMRAGNIAFNFVFVQGSRTRINGLKQGKYDFVVASSLTEQVLLKENDNESIEKAMTLPGCAYAGKYILLFADDSKTEIEDGMTIAVDTASIDQLFLTNLVCKGKKNIKFNELTYISTRFSVKEGASDATISRTDVIGSLGEGFQSHAKELFLPDYTRKELESFSTAVILIKKGNYGLCNILRRILRPSVVSNSQKKVMAGLRTPSYY
jgi:hypothetical protein